MGDFYLWVKVVHILAVISWMAGLFYLPRLFVYHAEHGPVGDLPQTFKVMERKLLKAIMRPAGVVAIVSGMLSVWAGNWYGPLPAWLLLKLGLVFAMAVFHGYLEWHRLRFLNDVEVRSGRYFRLLNEVPTVLLIGIVILAVVKPF